MRDSMRSQTLEACGGNRTDADMLRWLIAVRKMKNKEWPHEAPTSHHLWIRGSYSYLSMKLNICRRTAIRAIHRLAKRGLIKIHTSNEDDTNCFEVNEKCVENWMQRLPLFEDDPSDSESPALVTPSHQGGCHRVTTPGDSQSPPPLICAPIYPIITNADDVERAVLLEESRRLGVATEQAEYWLTKYTRPLLRAGIEYVRGRMAKERIDNPGGLLNSFLQNPGLRGYEMDLQGQWHRVGAKPKPSPYKPPPVDPDWRARYEASEEKRKREASAARERRLHAEVVPVGE